MNDNNAARQRVIDTMLADYRKGLEALSSDDLWVCYQTSEMAKTMPPAKLAEVFNRAGIKG